MSLQDLSKRESETSLKPAAGWFSVAMVSRHTSSLLGELAVTEFKRIWMCFRVAIINRYQYVARMAKGISDVSNFAVRIFLQEMGKFHDQAKGFPAYSKKHFPEVKEFFSNECCFCGDSKSKLTGDHLVPINKSALGLEAWGNIVPACSDCNSTKHSKDWETFLNGIAGESSEKRRKKIKDFIVKYDYSPDVSSIRIAVEELYEESGGIVLELIRLKTIRALARSK